MKNKRKMRLFAALLAIMLCMVAFPLTAFVGNGPEYEEALPEEQAEETTGEHEPQLLTPEGSMSLVDNTQGEIPNDKRFTTVVTKNGNYFYVIIDRAGDEENTVHFLGQVDETDLLDLMDEEVKPQEPIVTPELEPTPEPEPGLEPKKSGAGGILTVILILALGGGGTFYYFKIMKSEQSIKDSLNLNDFGSEDDEDERAKFEDE